MTKTEFAGFIREHGPVILDGATGTNLMEAGMPIGVCPESWVLENPQVLLDLQRRYVEAGSHIVCLHVYRKPDQTGRIWSAGEAGRNQHAAGSTFPAGGGRSGTGCR